jgi:hypothetical protein
LNTYVPVPVYSAAIQEITRILLSEIDNTCTRKERICSRTSSIMGFITGLGFIIVVVVCFVDLGGVISVLMAGIIMPGASIGHAPGILSIFR